MRRLYRVAHVLAFAQPHLAQQPAAGAVDGYRIPAVRPRLLAADVQLGGAVDGRQRGPAARRIPPLETARKLGVVIGAGTDAHRVASYNPFTCLQWILDGRTVEGITMRQAEERPTRADALRMYTGGSAWFAHADDRRGSLEAGKLADLAVLTKDYMAVPVEQIGSIESLLTMVAGKIVYSADPFR